MNENLGNQLRHLADLLDDAVSAAYKDVWINYRPRYTPIMQALIGCDPLTMIQIAAFAGITPPAVTQTVALMVRDGIIEVLAVGEDGRKKWIGLTHHGRELIPKLSACWRATAEAAETLEADVSFPLSEVVERAIDALEVRPFTVRIHNAKSISAKIREPIPPLPLFIPPASLRE